MTRVAVVHCFHSPDAPSGEDRVVEAEVAALRRAGMEVEVVGAGQGEGARHGPAARVSAAATVATGWGRNPLAALRRFAPDVVHVHNLFPFVGWRWLDRVEAPVVVTAHSYRALCANGFLFRGGEVCTTCVGRSQWPAVLHGCYQGSRLASVPIALGAPGRDRDPLLSRAACVLVPSERARSVLVGGGYRATRVRVSEHFLPATLDPGSGPRPGPGPGAWLFAGRLSHEKGIERLLGRWPTGHPLRVAGGGPLLEPLRRAWAGHRDITFLGQLDRAGVIAELGGARGLVFPSLWYETFGLVYLEALAAGVPVVAFPPTVVAEAVARDGSGVVASWDDVEGALGAAAAGGEGLRATCRAAFDARYREETFVARRRALYSEVGN